MATGPAIDGNVEQALDSVGVPSYVVDTTGVVRWINAAAERLLGDVRGRQFTSVVAPEDSRRARELVRPEGARHRPASRCHRRLWFRPPARASR
jgi:PAS domain-containing protein